MGSKVLGEVYPSEISITFTQQLKIEAHSGFPVRNKGIEIRFKFPHAAKCESPTSSLSFGKWSEVSATQPLKAHAPIVTMFGIQTVVRKRSSLHGIRRQLWRGWK
jgi:hypothetical protein